MTSFSSENEARNLQNGHVHLAQIPDFKMGYLENHLRIEVSDGSLFCIFHALSFERNLFFDRTCPLSNHAIPSVVNLIWCTFRARENLIVGPREKQKEPIKQQQVRHTE